MNVDEFRLSVKTDHALPGIDPLLKALWLDAKGDWEGSHNIVQNIDSKDAAWVHAYLHRKEGDIWNADYWYSQAGKQRPHLTLDEEWTSLVKHIISFSSNVDG